MFLNTHKKIKTIVLKRYFEIEIREWEGIKTVYSTYIEYVGGVCRAAATLCYDVMYCISTKADRFRLPCREHTVQYTQIPIYSSEWAGSGSGRRTLSALSHQTIGPLSLSFYCLLVLVYFSTVSRNDMIDTFVKNLLGGKRSAAWIYVYTALLLSYWLTTLLLFTIEYFNIWLHCTSQRP